MRNTHGKNRLATLLVAVFLGMPATAVQAADNDIRDPMQPTWLRGGTQVNPERSPRQRFSVDTIVVSPERRVAIINGRSVGVGEWVNGARVTKIDPDTVTLELDGVRFTIALAITDFKKVSRHGG
ncbi:MAG: general secretion pathway protein GspB [Gammaproteobacteria bacterium]|nr:general secretion pathway protein GspB [Gammaproteobacteria bacterium]